MAYHLVQQKNEKREALTTVSQIMEVSVKNLSLFINREMHEAIFPVKKQKPAEEESVDFSPDDFMDFEKLQAKLDGMDFNPFDNAGEWV